MSVSEDPRPDGEAERQSQDEERLRDHEERRRRLNEEKETERTVEETPETETREGTLVEEESVPPNPGGGNHEE